MTVQVSVTELQYIAGTSDKFYRVYEVNGQVVAQYGKNGSYGTFTYPPNGDANKVIKSKTNKGYTVVNEMHTSFDTNPTEGMLSQWADAQVVTTCQGMNYDEAPVYVPEITPVDVPTLALTGTPAPMLAHNAEPFQIEKMLTSGTWAMQPKLDGDRVLVEVRNDEIKAYGRNGQVKVSNVGAAMLAPFKAFLGLGHFVFDGEVVGQTLWLFDVVQAEGILDTKAPFADRYVILAQLVEAMQSSKVALVPVANTEADKRAMLAAAEANHKEGVIFRLLSSTYTVGRSYSLLKHKFVKTMDCIVTATGIDGKDNAVLSVMDHDGNLVEVGKASTIGKNKSGGGIKVGQVVEVKFLYVVSEEAPRLYQPRIVKVRTDKAVDECSTDQLIGTMTDKAVA